MFQNFKIQHNNKYSVYNNKNNFEVISFKKNISLMGPRALNKILKKVKKDKTGLDPNSLRIKSRSYWQDYGKWTNCESFCIQFFKDVTPFLWFVVNFLRQTNFVASHILIILIVKIHWRIDSRQFILNTRSPLYGLWK